MSPSSAGSMITRPRPRTSPSTSRTKTSKSKRDRTPTVFLLIVFSLVIQCLLFRTSERLKRNGLSPDRIGFRSQELEMGRSWRVVSRDDRPGRTTTRDYGEEDDEDSGTLLGIEYIKIYESASKGAKPFVFFGFTVWAAFLFATIGITASDFFCPNLATVADRLGMGESTAGVTFLAFGNGSPDVFSTFSALRSNTFSLAIGELLGASTFIISIVVGSMSLIQPFQVPRWPFVRDVGFFTLAVFVLVGCLLDGNLTILESGGLVGMYVVYVGVVVGGNWWLRRRRRKGWKERDKGLLKEDDEDEEDEDEEEVLLSAEDRPPSSSAPYPFSSQAHLAPPGESIAGESSNRSRSPSVSSSVSGHTLKQRPIAPRRSRQSSFSFSRGTTPYLFPSNRIPSDATRPTFSLLGAVEFRDVINSLRRESEVHGGDLMLPSPMGGPPTPLDQTPYEDGMSAEAATAAAEYFGQHNLFSRGHYHAHSPTVYHGQRHSVGSMAGFVSTSPVLGPKQKRSVSQVPSPLRARLGIGIRSASTHNVFTRQARQVGEAGDSERETLMSAGGSSRMIPGLRTSRSSEDIVRDRSGVPDIEESNEDSLAGTPTEWDPMERFAGLDPATLSQEGEGTVTPLKTPAPAPNPWEDSSTAGKQRTPAVSPARSKLSVNIPPDINARTHRAIPSISLIDPDESTNILLPKGELPRIGKRQRARLVFHKAVHLLFPSMHGFRHKSWIGRVLAVFAVPAIFCLTVTLPVVDDAAEGTALNRGGISLSEEDDTAEEEEPHPEEAGYGHQDDAEEQDIKHITARAGHALHHLVDEGAFPTPGHSPNGFGNPFFQSEHGKMGPSSEEDGASEHDGSEVSGSDISDNEEEFLFNKYLTAVQCVLGLAWCSTVIFSDQDWFKWELMGTLIAGSVAAVLTLRHGKDGHHPIWRMVRCFMGFFSAMVWIAAIADEVVQVLQCFGQILGLSDAIIGLTIFAVGNSLADWVANLTVATFAPSMSYAACFGGPMLNILLGVGGAGTYVIASTGRPYPVHVSPTLWVSAFGLIILLITTLCFVPYNGFLISRRWGWFLIAFYCVLTVVNIVIESRHGRM